MADFSERYQLRVPLGETEVGAVWEALDNEGGRSVVVVVLEEDAPEDLKAHFEKTYEALHGLDSPHLVKVLDRGQTDEGGPYAAIEKLEGRPLIAFMDDADAKASIREAVEWLMGALEGLEAAHGAGIAHGDMEPGNVFLADVGGEKVPKIIGWGLNRAFIRAGLHEPEDPEAESLLRSLAFAAPEQSDAKRGPEATDDLYGVAAILYDALTGELPHHGTSVDEIRESLSSSKVVPTQKLRREVAGTMAALVDRCLQSEIKRRPGNAQALHRSLKSALSFSSRIADLDLAHGRRSLTPSEELLEEKAKALEAGSGFAVPKPAGGGLSAKRSSAVAQTTPGIGAPAAAVPAPAVKSAAKEDEATDGPEEAEASAEAPEESQAEAPAAEAASDDAAEAAGAEEEAEKPEKKAPVMPKPKAPFGLSPKAPKVPKSPKAAAFPPPASKKIEAASEEAEEEPPAEGEEKRTSEEPGRILARGRRGDRGAAAAVASQVDAAAGAAEEHPTAAAARGARRRRPRPRSGRGRDRSRRGRRGSLPRAHRPRRGRRAARAHHPHDPSEHEVDRRGDRGCDRHPASHRRRLERR